MAADGFSNAYETTLNGSITNVASTLTVTSATGAPSVVPFRLRILAEGSNTTEIVTVTAVAGTTFTISRASESYAGVQTASAHASGATVEHVLTAGGLMTLASATAFIGARATHGTVTSLTNSVYTAVLFDGEEFDSDGFHSTSSNTGRLTIPAGMGGKYLIVGDVSFALAANGARAVKITKNAGQVTLGIQVIDQVASGTFAYRLQATAIADLVPGDYLELLAFQSSGGAINTNTTAGETIFSLVKLDSGKVGNGIGARVYNSSNLAINPSLALTFNSERFDTDGFHSTSSNTERFTIPPGLGGKYILDAAVEWAASTSGFRQLGLRINGTTYIGIDRIAAHAVAAEELRQTMSTIYDFVPGDYIEVVASQFSGGGSLNIVASGNYSPEFSIMRLDSGSSIGGRILLATRTASASATLAFEGIINGTYDEYEIEGIDIIPATNAQDLLMQIGTGTTPTYDTGLNYYGGVSWMGNVSGSNYGYNTGGFTVLRVVDNSASYGFTNFSLKFANPNGTGRGKAIHGTAYWHNGTQALVGLTGGLWNSTTVVTAIRFLMSSGNITSGTIRIYGMSK